MTFFLFSYDQSNVIKGEVEWNFYWPTQQQFGFGFYRYQ